VEYTIRGLARCVATRKLYKRYGGRERGVSSGAIHELVKRERQKVEVDWRNPRCVVTVPGEGCWLEVPW